ncbi:hypothetical protein B0I37DRAFT_439522 [Chaetomium sp. MPI-CAGE-AT-0009]|nr:hypothetical protein B0I37DRAFT_439522 [Chaetomium sp. MPI-CAGE-AT-0009]
MFGLPPAKRAKSRITAATMALVCSAPNLTKLYVSVDSTWQNTDFLLNKENGHVTGPKFTLPFLTTLDISHPPGIDHALGCRKLTASLPQLKKLHLCRTHVCRKGLRNLVHGSPRLAEVVVEHSRIPFPALSPRRALDALAPARLALRRLALHTWARFSWEADAEAPSLARLESVRLVERFPALTQLAVDAPMLAGLADMLEGLEALEGLALVKVKASEKVEGEIKELMRRVRLFDWPRLRKVKVQGYVSTRRFGIDEVWAALKPMLQRIGFRELGDNEDIGVVVAGIPRYFAWH